MARNSREGGGKSRGENGQRRKEDKKELFLRVAREVFARRGYHGVTIADITEEAGVGKGTFYLYFNSKEALFQEVVRDAVQRLRQALGKAVGHIDDPYTRVRDSVPVIFEVCRKEALLYLVIFQETSVVAQESPEGYRSYYAPLVRDFNRVIQEGVRRGIFYVRNAEVVSHGMIGLMGSLIYQWLLLVSRGEVSERDTGDMVETIADFVCHGLMGRPIPPPEEIDEKLKNLYRGQLEEVKEKRRELEGLEKALRSLLDRS